MKPTVSVPMPIHLGLRKLELHNFKSYRGGHSFEYPTRPGLYYLTGRNDADPRLGANGVGKSTLLDAVYWCLYGRSLRGLRGNEVVASGLKSCSVTLYLTLDKEYIIRRSQNPNLLTVDKLAVDQPYINKLLRLTPEQFTYSVIFPQFGSPFLDRGPTEKLDLFSQIMGLNYWLERSKQAQDDADKLTAAISALEKEIAKQEGQYEALEAELPKLRQKQDRYDDLSKIIAGFEAKLRAVKQKRQLARENEKKASNISVLAEQAERQTRQTIENIGDLKGTCPICLQTVSAAHLKAEKARLSGTIVTQKANAHAALADYQRAAAEVAQLGADEVAITKNLTDFTRQQAEAKTHASLIQAKSDQMRSLEVSIDRADKRLEALTSNLTTAEFWVKGFKRLRLFVVEETLHQLEIEVNNNLSSLGLPNWQITFDVERENKSGGITKGFTVFVQPPGSGGPVRLEAWSGGEYQRLRLAGDLGLANLIMDRAGLTNTIEFYDEPSRHLSAEGVADLAETLSERAHDTGRVIFLVDHASIESGNFMGTVTVVKDGDGSHVTV